MPEASELERVDLAVRSSGVGVWLNPLPLGELVWNDNVKAHFHLAPDARPTIELFFDRLHTDDLARVRQAIDRSVASGARYDEVFRTVGPQGELKWIHAVGRTRYDEAGQPVQFDGITLDITGQVLAQQQLREFADAAPAMLWVTGPDGVCSFLSKAWTAFTGQPEVAGLGFGWLEMVHPDDRAHASDAFLKANRTGEPFALEHRLRHVKDGWRWVLDAGRPRPAADGTFQGYVGSVTDIHDRRLAEDASRRSEERYRAFVANSTEGIWRMEFDPPVDTRLPAQAQVEAVLANGRFAECNEAFARMYGFADPRDVTGRKLDLVMDPRSASTREYLGAVIASGYRAIEIESEERDQHGRLLWFANNLSGVLEGDRLVRAWGTQRDITDRKRAEEALREADRRKDEFLATLAHELRNPLAPVRNAVEVLRLAGPHEPHVVRQREIIGRQVTHLARLIDDLMDVSRISRGRLDLRLAPVVLQDVLHAAAENAAEDLRAGRHELHVLAPPEPLAIQGDEVRLVQAVMNLLTNAARYSPDGEPVRLVLERQGDEALVRVVDRGIGLAPDERSHVFELFWQAPGAGRKGGLGIGLSLVQSLAQLHGGRAEVASDGPGRGSEFRVILPLRAAAPLPEPAAQPSGGRVRILVVDDNHDAADTLVEMLALMDHEARAAYDGPQALALVQSWNPGLLLLDLGMPGMDGYEVCRALRAAESGTRRRVIALSGWGQAADRQRTAAAGFDAHLVKPVPPDELARLLAQLPASATA